MANLESLKELLGKIEIKKAVNHNHFAIYSGGSEGCECDNSEILERLSALENGASGGVSYDDTELRAKITELENRTDNDTIYDDTAIIARVEALENKVDNDTIYDDSEIISEIATIKTQIQSLSAQGYDDTAITARIEALEAKTDNDTIYDDSAVVARIEALEAKTDNDTIYDDTELKNRVSALEARTDNDTIYDDSAIIARVEALENRTDNDTIYDDTALSARVSALENSSSSGGYDDSELRAQISALIAKVEALESYHTFTLSDKTKSAIINEIAVTKKSTANFKLLTTENSTLYRHPTAEWFEGELWMSPATGDDVNLYQEAYYRLNKSVEVAQDKAGASVGTFYANNLRFGFLDEDGNAIGVIDEWHFISPREGVEARGWVWLFENGVPKQKVAPFYFGVPVNS